MSKVICKGGSLREYGGKVLGRRYLCFGQGFALKGGSGSL